MANAFTRWVGWSLLGTRTGRRLLSKWLRRKRETRVQHRTPGQETSTSGDEFRSFILDLAEETIVRVNGAQGGVSTFFDQLVRKAVVTVDDTDAELETDVDAADRRATLEHLLIRRRAGRFVRFADRARTGPDEVPPVLMAMSQGVERCMHWKGMPLFKTVYDFALYPMLLCDLRPRTVVEIGSGTGASAIWLADLASAADLACHVYSMDVHKPNVKREGITFLSGDCNRIQEAFPTDFLSGLAHPVMILEDAHVNVLGVLRHFHPHLERGDYLVVEDSWGKQRALRSLTDEYGGSYAVDTHYVDFFGQNATCCKNSILARQ